MYSANIPINAVDLDGRQMGGGGLNAYFRNAFSGVNHTSIESNLSSALSETYIDPKSSIDATIIATDFISDGSTYATYLGTLCIFAGAALTGTGLGAPAGGVMMTFGAKTISIATVVGTTADITNFGAKVADINYGGSVEDAEKQFIKISADLITRKVAGSVVNSRVRLNSASRNYNPTNGRYVSNKDLNLLNAQTTVITTSINILINSQINQNNNDYNILKSQKATSFPADATSTDYRRR